MAFNRVKLGHVVTFMKYLASVVFLIFLPKTLTWNKIAFRLSYFLNLAVLVVNKLTKVSQKELPIFFFITNLSLLIVKISGAYN